MENKLQKIYAYIDAHREEMIETWKSFVNCESDTRNKESVDACAKVVRAAYEEAGFDCRMIDVGKNGNSLVGVLGVERPGKPVIFSGHMDTVFKVGTFGENPFRIEDGKAYGPGCLDMKGGLVIALYVVKALNEIGYTDRPIKFVFSGDEEIAHCGSTGAQVFLDEAKGSLCAFNMETGLIDGNLCIGRKGSLQYKIKVNGVESHSGNDFTSGRNAIEEMAHKILEIQALTDLERGTTYSLNVIKGGRVTNSIPDFCEAEVDIRFEQVEEMERIEQNMREICGRVSVGGTQTTFEEQTKMMPYETTKEVLRFQKFFHEVAAEFGFGDIGGRRLGGGSDASYVTIAGVPVLCSCGVQGEWNHTGREYAVVESLYKRAKMIATVVLNLDRLKNN